MKKTEAKALFKRYEPMLHKLAHRCAGRCRRPEAEVFGQACYEFMVACETYDAAKGEFGTWMYKVVSINLLHWGKKMDLPPPIEFIPDYLPAHTPTPDRELIVKEWLEGLSVECKTVARIILEGPAEMMCVAESCVMTRRAVLGKLTRYLKNERGWTWQKIWGTMKEMKEAVKELEAV